MNSGNLCPYGWRVPTNQDWTTLFDFLSNNDYGYNGNNNYIGKSLAFTSGWQNVGMEGSIGIDQFSNNSSKFLALPGGFRHFLSFFWDAGNIGWWWSSLESDQNYAWAIELESARKDVTNGELNKRTGLSVRCVKY